MLQQYLEHKIDAFCCFLTVGKLQKTFLFLFYNLQYLEHKIDALWCSLTIGKLQKTFLSLCYNKLEQTLLYPLN